MQNKSLQKFENNGVCFGQLKDKSVQDATVLQTDFTANPFWNNYYILAVFKIICWVESILRNGRLAF